MQPGGDIKKNPGLWGRDSDHSCSVCSEAELLAEVAELQIPLRLRAQ
jgi:hypothetical protein